MLLNTIGLSSWIAVIVGIRRNRPSYSLPWWLFAVGSLPVLDGRRLHLQLPQATSCTREVPFPSIGDAIYLTVYPALMLGLLLLVRRRNPQRNRNTLIDAAILTLGLSLLSWVLLIAPYLHDSHDGRCCPSSSRSPIRSGTSSCSPRRFASCSTAAGAGRPSTC